VGEMRLIGSVCIAGVDVAEHLRQPEAIVHQSPSMLQNNLLGRYKSL